MTLCRFDLQVGFDEDVCMWVGGVIAQGQGAGVVVDGLVKDIADASRWHCCEQAGGITLPGRALDVKSRSNSNLHECLTESPFSN